MSTSLTIREVAARTGTTVHTLRYYERIGLLPPVGRTAGGQRRFGPDDVRWVELLRRLHASGMPIRRMLALARLHRQGDSTIPERRRILDAHRVELEATIAQLRAALGLVRAKIARYGRAKPA